MQNVLTYICLFFTVLAVEAQSEPSSKSLGTGETKYEKGMQEAFKIWQENQPWEAANLFERIAKAEPDNWLPPYYVAAINIYNSFNEKDKTKISDQLKKGQDFINDASALSPENPELLILQAQLYTAWIVFDGQQYGMEYSSKASGLYEKAVAMAPNNPSMVVARAEWNIGSAKYFGESVEKYCDEIRRAIELSKTFEVKEAFYPHFNLERAKQVMEENCK